MGEGRGGLWRFKVGGGDGRETGGGPSQSSLSPHRHQTLMKTIGSSVSALSSFLGFYLQNGRRGSEGDAQFVKRLKEAAAAGTRLGTWVSLMTAMGSEPI